MAGYKVSEITREKILNAARELFYEKGYEKTTYAEICRKANVREGTLHYQYKSKAAVGKAINLGMINRNAEDAKRLIGTDTLEGSMTGYALFNFIYWYKFFADEKYARFSYEIAQEYKTDEMEEYYGAYVPVKWLFEKQNHEEERELKLNRIACISIDAGIPRYIMNHMDEYKYYEVAEYMLGIYADLLGYDREEMNGAIEEAKKIMESSDLDFLKIDMK